MRSIALLGKIGMSDHTIILPSKPKVVSEDKLRGVYEIDSLYPGYGHTLGNSLRRIILSSLPGTALTVVKIDGVKHEFSTLDGLKEDIITLILNLKKVRFKSTVDEPQEATLRVKELRKITAADIKTSGQVEVLNKDQYIAEITDKKITLDVTMQLEQGLGYIPKRMLQQDKVEVGTIVLDAVFTPIRRVNYEVENMRVGDRTDYNKLRIFIETDGTLSPREALERSIEIMIKQLKAVVGFQEEEKEEEVLPEEEGVEEVKGGVDKDFLRTRIDTLGFSTRTANALASSNIRTVGGLIRKSPDDLYSIDGLGEKGMQEIRRTLGNFGVTLK
ncbi:DNA-directed RNA polymerase subunit alpha [bacterium]|nr:DNA-directed RNA polymerase subunit alpha [bacterium]|tara:strand:+ start:1177 stop:2169 length:993 start_codon:yes stop_codon:yes gene_type:complete